MTPTLPTPCATRDCAEIATTPDGYCPGCDEDAAAEWDRISTRLARKAAGA